MVSICWVLDPDSLSASLQPTQLRDERLMGSHALGVFVLMLDIRFPEKVRFKFNNSLILSGNRLLLLSMYVI